MVRLTLALPFNVVTASSMIFLDETLRKPELSILSVGTLKVMRSLSKVTTTRRKFWPAMVSFSTPATKPTPWVG